jgi:hypothetical protein
LLIAAGGSLTAEVVERLRESPACALAEARTIAATKANLRM